MILRELLTKWGFQINDAPLKKMDEGISNVKESLFAVGTAAVGAAGTLFGLAKSTAAVGDAAAKMSTSLGISAETLQELHFAASIGGVASGEMNKSLLKLSRTASDAQRGLSTAQDAFTDVGISVTDANGKLKSSDVLLTELSEQFSKMPDGTKKSALAMELFGRSGAKLIPMLNGGAKGLAELRKEAQESGFVIGETATKQSEEFNDAIFRLQSVVIGFRNTIGVQLIPIIREVVDSFREWLLGNRDLIKSKIGLFVKGLISFLKAFWGITKRVISVTMSLADAFGGVEKILKAVTIALLIFMGAKMLLGIGQMIQGIFGIVQAFKTLKIGILLTQAAALIFPILIGAAFIALLLIFEDIYASMTGKDSLFNLFEEMFPKAAKGVQDVFFTVFDAIFGTIEWVQDKFGEFVDFVLDIPNKIREAFMGIGEMVKSAFSGFGGGLLKKLIPGAELIASGFDAVTGSSPESSPLPSGGGATTNNVSMNPNISIEVPPGTPPELVGNAVSKGMDDAISKMLRQASRTTKPQEAF